MQLDTNLPEFRKGFLISGRNTKYSNSSAIQVNKICFFQYFKNTGGTTEDRIEFNFGSSSSHWYYKDMNTLLLDYYQLFELLMKDSEPSELKVK